MTTKFTQSHKDKEECQRCVVDRSWLDSFICMFSVKGILRDWLFNDIGTSSLYHYVESTVSHFIIGCDELLYHCIRECDHRTSHLYHSVCITDAVVVISGCPAWYHVDTTLVLEVRYHWMWWLNTGNKLYSVNHPGSLLLYPCSSWLIYH